MVCARCGIQIKESERACVFCGAPNKGGSSPPLEVSESVEVMPPEILKPLEAPELLEVLEPIEIPEPLNTPRLLDISKPPLSSDQLVKMVKDILVTRII